MKYRAIFVVRHYMCTFMLAQLCQFTGYKLRNKPTEDLCSGNKLLKLFFWNIIIRHYSTLQSQVNDPSKRYCMCVYVCALSQRYCLGTACTCVGTNVCGHNRVRAQSCLGTIVSGLNRVWAQSCVGTIVCGQKRVWAQSCVGTIVSGHNRVWAQSCLGTIVGTNVSGHNRVGWIVWAQSCMGPIVVEPLDFGPR